MTLREIPAGTEEERVELERFIKEVWRAGLEVAAEMRNPERVHVIAQRALLDVRFPGWRDRG